MEFYLRGAKLIVNPTTSAQGREFNVRMSFNVVKCKGGTLGPGTQVTLYNLSDASRAYLEGRVEKTSMQLLAGYGGDLRQIFTGEIYWVSTERHGPDVLTSIQSMRGIAAIQFGHLDENGIRDDADLFERILVSFAKYGIGRGYISQAAQDKFKATNYTAKRRAVSGMTNTILDGLLTKHGLQMTIDHNVLNVFDKGFHLNPKVIVLGQDTGMLGTPTRENTNTIKVKSYLNPLIEPGVLLEVHSKLTKLPARMNVSQVTHTGDTLEGPWESAIEVYEPGTTASLSAGNPEG